MSNIKLVLNLAQIIVSVLLILLVSLQNRTSGLSNVFGGAGSVVSTRRGSDKWLFVFTIIIAILFVATSIASLYFSNK